MASFNWTADLATGNGMIDQDHKHLIALVNKLNDAMAGGKGNAVLGPILDELIAYTVSHFGREERLMQQIAYADYAAHKAEHTKLIGEVQELRGKFAAGALTLSSKVYLFLCDWLNTHIKSADVRLGKAAAST